MLYQEKLVTDTSLSNLLNDIYVGVDLSEAVDHLDVLDLLNKIEPELAIRYSVNRGTPYRNLAFWGNIGVITAHVLRKLKYKRSGSTDKLLSDLLKDIYVGVCRSEAVDHLDVLDLLNKIDPELAIRYSLNTGTPYLHLSSFRNIRSKIGPGVRKLKSKYPGPEENKHDVAILLGIAHTGSNSQRSVLEHATRKHQFFSFESTAVFDKYQAKYQLLDDSSKRDIKFYHIHACIPVDTLLSPSVARYVAFFRNPIEMFATTCMIDLLEQRKKHSFVGDVGWLDQEMRKYVEQAERQVGSSGRLLLLSRFILSLDQPFKKMKALAWPPNEKELFGHLSDGEIFRRSSEIIEKKFLFIGLSEFFDCSVLIMLELLEQSWVPLIPKLHVTGGSNYEMPVDLKGRLERLMRVDLMLYESVKNKFLETFGIESARFKFPVYDVSRGERRYLKDIKNI